ncbi:hypothetical protein VTK26DRAFT_4708 [Humicola hyalothermophila]
MIEVLYSGQAAMEAPRVAFAGDERRMKEFSLMRGNKRAPRRSQTHYEYIIPQPPTFPLYTIPQSPTSASTPTAEPTRKEAERPTHVPARRPPLGPPRRSYSVTDQEPLPHHHRPSSRLTLMDLPAELHYAIFDFLDPIDSTCFGLTNSHFYAIHRRLHGSVPLTARRDGPNELEWAWHTAGNVVRSPQPSTTSSSSSSSSPGSGCDSDSIASSGSGEMGKEEEGQKKNGDNKKETLSKLRVRGQAYCRICGVTRCQLHKHIQGWMGEGLEYCSVRQKFGPVAPEGSKAYCYMCKPGDPTRCGRHWVRRHGTKVELR